jgi:hypothetical protein
MREQSELLRRQAEQQRRLRDLSWPEKVRMIERVRGDVVRLREARVVPETVTGEGDTTRSR